MSNIKKNKWLLWGSVSIVCIGMLFVMCSCDKKENKKIKLVKEYTRDVFAMDTYMTLKVYSDDGKKAENALDESVSEIEKLDDLFSVGNEQSEVSILNESGSEFVSEDFINVIKRAKEISEDTDGAFDITIFPLMEEWGFVNKNFKVLGDNEIKELLEHVNYKKVDIDESEDFVSIDENSKIDLGGIVKGYASDMVMDIIKKNNIDNAVVSLGGNVACIGKNKDDKLWKVAIKDPDNEDDYLGSVEVSNKSVITSGGYERFFEKDGKKYHHILDPKTGKPSDSGVSSVTIISEDGLLADALSTSLFVMGKEKAEKYWRKHSDEFDYILKTDSGEVILSEGVKDIFTSDNKYTVVLMEERN